MSVLPQKFAFYCYSTRERLDQRGGRALAGVTAAYLFACFYSLYAVSQKAGAAGISLCGN